MKRIILVLAAFALCLIMAPSLGAQCTWVSLFTFNGEAASNFFGQSVSAASDVDNDGYDDVIVGTSFNDAGGNDAGRAYVYSGKTGGLLYTFTGEAAGDRFGCSVSGAGDVNADGYDDLIVGAWWNQDVGVEAGKAYVFSGENGNIIWTFTAEAAHNWFGNAVSGAGDVNMDGYDDVIIGARGCDAGGNNAGRAYVFSGKDKDTLHIFTGEDANDNFGRSVSGAGDVNNDGRDDLIIGAEYAGKVYVYSGQGGGLLHTYTEENMNDEFGVSVSGAGYVNDDEYADIII